MAKMEKCKKCGREYSGWICPNNCNIDKPKVEVKEKLKTIVEEKPKLKSLNQKKVKNQNKTSDKVDKFKQPEEEFTYYTLKKNGYNHRSIVEEIVTVKVGDKYVLKEDIIQQRKADNL